MKTAHQKYLTLVNFFQLRPITTDRGLEKALAVADGLAMRDDLSKDESDYLDVLLMLISDYEGKAGHTLNDPVEPLEVLKFLMEENDLRQAHLAKLLGISSGNCSEVMSGKRELSKAMILALAARFKVHPSLFLPAVPAIGAELELTDPKGRTVSTTRKKTAKAG